LGSRCLRRCCSAWIRLLNDALLANCMPIRWAPLSAPGDAGRRSPSPRPGAPPTTPGSRSARRCGVPARRAALAGASRDRRAPQEDEERRAEACRPGAGTEARRPAVDRACSPPRGPRGGGGDRAGRDSRASWGPLVPSDGCGVPGRTERCNPENGSRGRGGGAPAVAPGESCGCEHRPPRPGRPGRVASPPGSRRTPDAGTFQLERVRRPRSVQPAGPASVSRCRHAATAHAGNCQAESAGSP